MNIKNKKTILTLYTVAAIIIGASLAIWRTVLLKQTFDPYDGTFELGSGKTLLMFEYILLLASAIAATSCFFIKGTALKKASSSNSTALQYVYLACGIILATVGVITLFYYFGDIFAIKNNSGFTKIGTPIAFILLFFVAVYFFVSAKPKYEGQQFTTILSFAAPLFVIAYVIASYFNSDFVYNDFNRITCHLAFLAILLFSLSESNLLLNRPAYALRFVSSLLCIILIPTYIVPMTLLAAFWEISFTSTLLIETSQIAFLIYAIYSAISAITHLKPRNKTDNSLNTAE